MNRAILMGRLVRQPELRQTQSGTDVCSFTLAIDRRFKNQNGERQTDFIPCVAWGKTAEFCAKYFSQGQRMAVVGSIQPRSWEDQEGNKRTTTEVIAEEVYFADSKRSDDAGTAMPQGNYRSQGQTMQQNTAVQPQVNKPVSDVSSYFPDETDDTLLPFDI